MFFRRVCWDSDGDSWIKLGSNNTACYKQAVSFNIWIAVQVPDIDFNVVLSPHQKSLCWYLCQIAGKRFQSIVLKIYIKVLLCTVNMYIIEVINKIYNYLLFISYFSLKVVSPCPTIIRCASHYILRMDWRTFVCQLCAKLQYKKIYFIYFQKFLTSFKQYIKRIKKKSTNVLVPLAE